MHEIPIIRCARDQRLAPHYSPSGRLNTPFGKGLPITPERTLSSNYIAFGCPVMAPLSERAFIMQRHTDHASLSICTDQTRHPPSEQTRAFEHQSSFLTTPRYKVELLRLQGNFSLQHRSRGTEMHPVLEAEPEKKKQCPLLHSQPGLS